MLEVERNSIISEENEELVKVTDFSVFDEFDCADRDLNDFICNDAPSHREELIAETYLFKWRDLETPPIAFVSLLNDKIALSTNRERRIVPNRIRRYSEFPAVKIGRLGVNEEYQRKSVGSTILDMIKTLLTTDNRTGCRFLTVEAYNTSEALKFYHEKNDFSFFPIQEQQEEDTRFMFFDLARYINT